MKQIIDIPLSSIIEVEIFLNKFRYSVTQVAAKAAAKRPGCKVYVVTGGMWNSDGSACPLLKANGRWISGQPWGAYGYGWGTGPDIALTSQRDAKRNFWATSCLIGPNGPISKPSYDKRGQGGKRGRAGVGMKPGYLRLYASQDKTSDARTPEALRDDMAADGCTSFVMGDGGGSAQCWFDGKVIKGDGRKCHNYIIVYVKNESAVPPKKEETTVNKPIVCLDPGHGPGNANASADGSYKEHEFTWDLYTRLRPLLEAKGIQVISTREKQSDYPSLSARASISNRAGADVFVSIHSNAAKATSVRGFVAFTSAPPPTAARNKLAADIVNRVREAGVVMWNNGTAHEMYDVLARTTAPAVLLECGFHTNLQDLALLKDSNYRDKLAKAICAGICDFLNVEVNEPDGESGQPNQADTWAQEAWEKATKAGVFDGTRPRDALTRQEAAVILSRLKMI